MSKKHEKCTASSRRSPSGAAPSMSGSSEGSQADNCKGKDDYNGNIKKVVDVVRGTIEFPSLDGFVQG